MGTRGRALRVLPEPSFLVLENPADGHDRPGAVKVGDKRSPDLRIRGQLAEMDPTHAPGGNVADQERPPGQAAAGQRGDQIFGGTGRRRRVHGRNAPGVVRTGTAVRGFEQQSPPNAFESGKFQVVVGADEQSGGTRQPPGFLQVDEVPSRVTLAAFLGAPEASRGAVLNLYSGDDHREPPPRAPPDAAGTRPSRRSADGARTPSCSG